MFLRFCAAVIAIAFLSSGLGAQTSPKPGTAEYAKAHQSLQGLIQEVNLEKKTVTVRGSVGQPRLGAKLVVKTITLSLDDKTVIEARTYDGEVAGRAQYHISKWKPKDLKKNQIVLVNFDGRNQARPLANKMYISGVQVDFMGATNDPVAERAKEQAGKKK
jgi:hypothetical protein